MNIQLLTSIIIASIFSLSIISIIFATVWYNKKKKKLDKEFCDELNKILKEYNED